MLINGYEFKKMNDTDSFRDRYRDDTEVVELISCILVYVQLEDKITLRAFKSPNYHLKKTKFYFKCQIMKLALTVFLPCFCIYLFLSKGVS